MTTRCRACESMTFPPKVICPRCWSEDLQWVEPGITGTLYSWTRVHAAPAVFRDLAPYSLGIVDLDSGIRLACPIVSEEALSCEMRVELVQIQFTDGAQLAAKAIAD